MNCPCRSGEIFDLCCGRFISHRLPAENAQQLMRSRYSAYVLNDVEYLNETWHPDYRPAALQPERGIRWLRLDVIAFCEQGYEATVEFEALFLVDGRVDTLHESSRFVFEQGRWLYTSGEMMEPTRKPFQPARNTSCPCASGLKFKRCCGG